MESKLSSLDQDEWFYESLKKYKNLYMFELEFPVDSIEIISETSLVVSGIQNYSKKCEVLQLSVPPKLLPKDIEEGLCKDRDFKILSGGYSDGRIKQIKGINFESTGAGAPGTERELVAVIQSDNNSINILELGNDEHALINPKSCLNPPEGSGIPDVIEFNPISSQLYSSHLSDRSLLIWDLKSQNDLPKKFQIEQIFPINKIVSVDSNSLIYCTVSGAVVLFDLREGNEKIISQIADSNLNSSLFSFDYCTKSKNVIGRVDSNGGFELFDIRNSGSPILGRTMLPEVGDVGGVIRDKFNLAFDPSSTNHFIVSGFKEDVVKVYEYSTTTGRIEVSFSHDGHLKTVTHSLWHPNPISTEDKLLFSCSIDSMLHAWQYSISNTATNNVNA